MSGRYYVFASLLSSIADNLLKNLHVTEFEGIYLWLSGNSGPKRRRDGVVVVHEKSQWCQLPYLYTTRREQRCRDNRWRHSQSKYALYTVSEIRQLIGWKLRIIHTPLLFGAQLPMFPLEFPGEVKRQEMGVIGVLCGEGCMILTSTVFDWSTRVTDGQTDRRTDGRTGDSIARYSIYAVAR